MSRLRKLTLLSMTSFFFCLVIAVPAAEAEPVVIGQSDFSGTETVITFDSIPHDEEITTQFSSQGVTFSGGLFSRTDFNRNFFVSPGAAVAGNFSNNALFNSVTVDFSSGVTRVGFNVVTNPQDDIRVTSFRLVNGFYNQIGSFVFITDGTLPDEFVGFEDTGGSIDRIVIDAFGTDNDAFAINDLRFEGADALTPVPEPATMLLLGSGLVGVAARVRNRRKGIKR
ncbi:MAG: PEP-CTERM sorting domain-containing protein [Acidobacteriota bacterium]|nr:PEP-CTERM sorting domain-containing protein [Acidobacteriota bacterium]